MAIEIRVIVSGDDSQGQGREFMKNFRSQEVAGRLAAVAASVRGVVPCPDTSPSFCSGVRASFSQWRNKFNQKMI